MFKAGINVPTNMSAVVQSQAGGELELQTLSTPVPARNQVLVKIHAAPVNPSDLAMIEDHGFYNSDYPLVPGLEGCGTVVASGAGLLPRWLIGKQVACSPLSPGHGSYADYMLANANQCIPLSKDMDLQQASMLLINPFTALAFIELARRNKHHAIVNTAAASALGVMLARLGKLYDIPVIHVVRRESQRQSLLQLGYSTVINSASDDFATQLQTHARALQATLWLDAVGGDMIANLLQAAPNNSTLVSYACLSRQVTTLDTRLLLTKNIMVHSWYLPRWIAQQGRLRLLFLARRIRQLANTVFTSPIRETLPFSEAQQAVQKYTSEMSRGKILLTPQANPT